MAGIAARGSPKEMPNEMMYQSISTRPPVGGPQISSDAPSSTLIVTVVKKRFSRYDAPMLTATRPL